ncbi:hypothetical protein D3C81_1521330 [compost metagenome]
MRAVDARLGQRCRAPFGSAWHQHCVLRVARALPGPGGCLLQAGELGTFVVHVDHTPVHVQIWPRVLDQGEAQPRLQAHVIALHFGDAGIVAQRGDPGGGEGHANRITLVATGVVKALVRGGLVCQATRFCAVFLVVGRVGERIVALHLTCSTYLLAVAQAA